ncbi:MAG: hypothetical protein IKL36_01960 [Clostridia bacterium]|nr:hypothetical protein [Clostridia bacterium]
MNKTEKRQSDLRNKLVAAVAMLLVSCIMMVSTTYAWFTLSTAPEVQGITTTVGANGNLEIALSPLSGNAEDITSAMGDANKTWAEKNTTWGNLINLSDNSVYGLDKITLLPTRLNVGAGEGTSFKVNETSPLKTPTYGADGRPQALNANTTFGSKFDADQAAATDFLANLWKGIRVIGTSADMSEYEVTFNAALSDLAAAISSAKTNAQNSLNENGGTLTGIAIQHGLAGDSDSNNYKNDIAGLAEVLEDLQAANDELAKAIKAAVLAEAASSKSTVEKYTEAVQALSGNAAIDAVKDYLSTYPLTTDNDISANITAAIAKYTSNQTAISTATANFNTINAKDTVVWSDVSTVLNPLMNTSAIKINGKLMPDFKAMGTTGIGQDILKNGLNITMVSGSGLYADFGAVVGNLEATVLVPTFTYDGTELGGWDAYMKTDSEAVAGGYMPAVRTAIALAGVLTGDGTTTTNKVINVPYAYAVDFMFRTNAAGSKLMLQTSPAQRVYEESVSSATQGSGSTMTFAVTEALSAEATLNLMKSIRVVFMDTASNTVYGVAKIDTTKYEVAGALTGLTEIEGDLYLHSFTVNTDGILEIGSKIAEDQANLCDLPQNTAKAVSALVYLDGDNVTNADVANGVTSMMGTMNLQFSSSAELVPMENTALKEMTGEGEYKVTVDVNNGLHKESKTVTAGAPFEYTIPASLLDAYNVETVTVTMNNEEVSNAWDGSKISIGEVTGPIVVTVTVTAK